MPWTKDDVEKHKKGLTDKQKGTWVKVANSALQSCLDKGGSQDDCEASAIKQANSVAGNQKKGRGMDILNRLQELFDQFIQRASGELKEPPERAIGTYRLHEQFYALLREEDEWPRVLDIYLDDGDMYGLVASGGKLYRYPLAVVDDDLQIAGERQQVMEIHAPVAERSIITIHRQADGRVRLMTVACTAILNRVGEIDSTTLFDNMIRRAEESGEYPYVTLWHQGKALKMGQVDLLARDGVAYIVSALFDEGHELGEAVARDVEEDPDFWGTSIKYLPVGDPEMAEVAPDIHIPVYRDGKHIEISLLPEKRAASWFTTAGVNTQEVQRMRPEIEALIRKVLPEDMAEKWVGRVDDINRQVDEEGMVARAEEEQPAEGEPPEQTQDAPPAGDVAVELDDEALGAIVRTLAESDDLMSIIQPLYEAVERQGKQIEALTKEVEKMGAASTEGLVQVRERLDELEREEDEKQREWLADLPSKRVVRATYRPSQANDPTNGDGRPPSLADVAESTLSSMPRYGSRR